MILLIWRTEFLALKVAKVNIDLEILELIFLDTACAARRPQNGSVLTIEEFVGCTIDDFHFLNFQVHNISLVCLPSSIIDVAFS